MRINRAYFALIWLLFAVYSASHITELVSQDDHFNHLHADDYVLSLIFDSKAHPKHKDIAKKLANAIVEGSTATTHDMVIELIDTKAIPFFDEHYDLEGKSSLKLFVRNQVVKNDGINDIFSKLDTRKPDFDAAVQEVERWISYELARISTHLPNIHAFRMLVHEHRLVGLYSGTDGPNFVRYFRVARKNIDFVFAHTFDPELAANIYEEFAHLPAPEGDTFAVIRSRGIINEFDPAPLVPFADFDERALTEFMEFERYAKLRPAAEASNIYKKLFLKYQPLLVHTGSEEGDDDRFGIFGEAIKGLPKNMIYAHADYNSTDAGLFHNLFMQAKQAFTPNSLNLIYAGIDRKLNITEYRGAFSAEGIKSFAEAFMKEKAEYFKNARDYLYDKVENIVGGEHKKDNGVDTEL